MTPLSVLIQLLESAMEQASELFRRNEDHELLAGLRTAGLEGEVQRAEQLTVQFAEHQEQLEEVGQCTFLLLCSLWIHWNFDNICVCSCI